MAIVAGVASIAVIAAGVVGVGHLFNTTNTANAVANPNCSLIVPANPLTAQGLATPYQLTATNPANGPCNEANATQTAFVQGAVLNPATGQISVYNPLVVDAGTQPAVAPTAPTLPANAVVGLWFGFNGTTLTLVGADQAGQAAAATTPAATATTAATPTAAAATPTATVTPTAAAATPTAAVIPTVAATPTATAANPAATANGGAAATPMATATATAVVQAFIRHHHGQGAAAATPTAATMTTAPAGTMTTAPAGVATSPAAMPTTTTGNGAAAGTATAPTVTGTQPPAGTNTPAASGTPDAILQGANCIAGENIAGAFSSFTEVAACNAVAFFAAANTAIQAGQLTVPNPGTALDGQPCETTRNFAVIDQDQSDNVTTLYLANGNGQTAQDIAANAAAAPNDTVLANGSDNGLIDFHVDPALGCTPWMVPNLASAGTNATALPLDELQAAAFAGQSGGPAALVPLNDPMTLDGNGNQNTDKTNAYRSIMDQTPLPTGETPATYCGDMESIQGVRLQQDVNLMIGQASPLPAMASNLFTFMAMRLQQSFTNLNCQNFGLQNDVTTTVNGNGVVVAACFLQQVNPVTAGTGNPTAGMTVCPATTTATATPTATATNPAAAATTPVATPPAAAATPTAANPAGVATPGAVNAAGAATPATVTPATATPAGAATPAAPTATGNNGAGNPIGGSAGVANSQHQHWWY